MKLASSRLALPWPDGLGASGLRRWLLDQLGRHGTPLRWSITAISLRPGTEQRLIEVEAVFLHDR